MTLEETKEILIYDNSVTVGEVGKLQYLYGVDRASWLGMNYIDAFERKNKLAHKVIDKCLEVDYKKRDYNRINACKKAIKFNFERLSE